MFGLSRSANQVVEGLKGKDFSLALPPSWGLYDVLDLAVLSGFEIGKAGSTYFPRASERRVLQKSGAR